MSSSDMGGAPATEEGARAMRSFIQRIATGPTLSKDLSLEEAREGMALILEGRADPVQAGIFLIALRMKRETDDETKGVLEAVRAATARVDTEVDELVDLADPYDGYNRSLPASPFLPAVLAACRVPTVSHGVLSMGPKYGVTHARVLAAAGAAVDEAPERAAARVADPEIGWSYVDQRQFCPKLHALAGLRTLMVKRPVITTVEVLAGPMRGRRATHLVTGYVHKPYPRIYALLARHAGFDSALLVRGVEGGVIPSLRQAGKVWRYRGGGEEEAVDIEPQALGIEQAVRAAPLPEHLGGTAEAPGAIGMDADVEAAAQAAAEAGTEALAGRRGATYDALVYGGALCLWHLGRGKTPRAAADAVRRVLDSGEARARFEAGVRPQAGASTPQ